MIQFSENGTESASSRNMNSGPSDMKFAPLETIHKRHHMNIIQKVLATKNGAVIGNHGCGIIPYRPQGIQGNQEGHLRLYVDPRYHFLRNEKYRPLYTGKQKRKTQVNFVYRNIGLPA